MQRGARQWVFGVKMRVPREKFARIRGVKRCCTHERIIRQHEALLRVRGLDAGVRIERLARASPASVPNVQRDVEGHRTLHLIWQVEETAVLLELRGEKLLWDAMIAHIEETESLQRLTHFRC